MFNKFFQRGRKKKSLSTASGFSRPSTCTSGARGDLSVPTADTRAAIDELSFLVKNHPEAVEIYLALGNLYRSQGEIERAIQIRNSLIVRSGVDDQFKARAWFELGRDFLRAGLLDRCAHALEKAEELSGDNPEIVLEMARLAARTGEYARAAELYDLLDQPLIQAHYLVKQAGEHLAFDEESQGKKLIKQALKVYPGSPEAWLETLRFEYSTGKIEKFQKNLAQALISVPVGIRFILLEGLYDDFVRKDTSNTIVANNTSENNAELGRVAFREAVVPVLEEQQTDVLVYYYGACILLASGEQELARLWFEKTLLLYPDFWLARLELFELSSEEQQLTPFFKEQLNFFLQHARNVKRFLCKSCGFKSDQFFFTCPKCQCWHSISFRKELTR
ncbi:MAG: tetratricopeptide repeat protein [Desulfovibrio sp.]